MFTTPSIKSNTNKDSGGLGKPGSGKQASSKRARTKTGSKKIASGQSLGVRTHIQYLKGVGPKLGGLFCARGIKTVGDLMFFFPRGYQDRSKISRVGEAVEGEPATFELTVLSSRAITSRRVRQKILEVRARDESGVILLKWFRAPGHMIQNLSGNAANGRRMMVTGSPTRYMNQLQIVHPEISFLAPGEDARQSSDFGRIVPLYTEIEGIATRKLRTLIWEAFQKYKTDIQDDVPEYLLEKYGLPSMREAVEKIHFPKPGTDPQRLLDQSSPSHQRIIYDEFLKFEYLVLKQRLQMQKERARAFDLQKLESHSASLQELLPFELTGGQKSALKDILDDLAEPHPMNRLVQGDVGCGKTAVALLATGVVLAEGSQAALMAPTEILAEQHYKNCLKIFGHRIRVALLTGKTRKSERDQILGRLRSSEPMLLVGTHALIEPDVEFIQLGLVLIDEQHRFGVDQRKKLRHKGPSDELPHQLVLTATPIPRTLALTAYGDLSLSVIKELPPGRSPVATRVVRTDLRQQAFEFIRDQLKKGRQAYFIYPLVNESEAEGFKDLKSAVEQMNILSQKVYPEFKVEMIHGQLKSNEKAKIMDAFYRVEIQVLVSTTVVEVGVDCPNATVMVIEHAERFGLSQLHQLRGRVGRGEHKSYCFLMCGQRVAPESYHRLSIMEQTQSGFQVAEEDLKIRGPGQFMGTRQSGDLPFLVGNIARDGEWIERAREDALEILRVDPGLSDEQRHWRWKRFMAGAGRRFFDNLMTS